MAKSSVPGLDRIGDLFTSAERAVLESTAGAALVAASRKQLDAALARARALRDKWRDLHAAQSRTTKRAAGAGGANARSREKAAMFSAAIERIQTRLADLGLSPRSGRPAAKSASKTGRRAGHRTSRAGMKGELAATAAAMNRSRATKSPAPPPARPAAAPAPARPAAAIVKRAASRPKQVRSRKPTAAPRVGGQAVRFDVAQQRSAKASATAARLTLDGKVTRRGGHVLAAGKRRQAARDRRGR